ncbi:hypothetical protein [Salmonella sp. SAL04284]
MAIFSLLFFPAAHASRRGHPYTADGASCHLPGTNGAAAGVDDH